VRAIWSLSLVPDPRDLVAEGAMLTIALAAVVAFARGGVARARLRAALPWLAWGTAWFLLASAAVSTIFPHWLPNRSQFGSVGLGIAAVAMLEAAHPALVAALVAVRLVLLAMSPGPAAVVAEVAPRSGAFVDFARLTRLQRLMRDTRSVLQRRHPTLPLGATVVWHYFPHEAQYAFGGDRALRAWYRDSTLRWVSFSDWSHAPDDGIAIVEFQADRPRQAALVDPDAMRALLLASELIRRAQWDSARQALDRAQAAQPDSDAAVFVGNVLSKRALCHLNLGAPAAAEHDAITALRIWPKNPDSRYVLGKVRFRERRLDEAEAQIDTLLTQFPGDHGAAALRDSIRAARASVPR
jgi:tetratricopeptide (TPR) repeat protein